MNVSSNFSKKSIVVKTCIINSVALVYVTHLHRHTRIYIVKISHLSYVIIIMMMIIMTMLMTIIIITIVLFFVVLYLILLFFWFYLFIPEKIAYQCTYNLFVY